MDSNTSKLKPLAYGVAIGSLVVGSVYFWKSYKRERARELVKVRQDKLFRLFEKSCIATNNYTMEFLNVSALGIITCANHYFYSTIPQCHAWKIVHQLLSLSPIEQQLMHNNKAVQLLLKRRHDSSRATYWKPWIEDLKRVVGQHVVFSKNPVETIIHNNGPLFVTDGFLSHQPSALLLSNKEYIYGQRDEGVRFLIVEEYNRAFRAKSVEGFLKIKRDHDRVFAYHRERQRCLEASFWFFGNNESSYDMLDRVAATLLRFVYRSHWEQLRSKRNIFVAAQRDQANQNMKINFHLCSTLCEQLRVADVSICNDSSNPFDADDTLQYRKDALSAVSVPGITNHSPGDFLEAIINGTLRGTVFSYQGRNL